MILKGYLHKTAISKRWVVTYEKQKYITSEIPIHEDSNMNFLKDNKEVEFELIENKKIFGSTFYAKIL
jgi:hypothetical protein